MPDILRVELVRHLTDRFPPTKIVVMLTVIHGSGADPSGLATGTFTGEAWRDMLLSPTDGVAVSNVFFTPRARTFWHSHVGGQLITVVAGEGFVADETKTALVRAGDMVWTPPGVRHWHGASPGHYFLHTAVTIGATDWDELVSEETYNGYQKA